ncbi:MAG: hypothetical protein U0176_01165 [Bacteroidia bacterium]
MRPILMIDDLKTLHDARYCAAVGIAMVSFDMRPGGMAAPTVREIVEWLSGIDCYGRIGHLRPEEIADLVSQSGIAGVVLPLDYPESWVADLETSVVYDASEGMWAASSVARLQEIQAQAASALFLVPAGALDHASNMEASLIARMIVISNDPDSIFHRLENQGKQPFGFCLGTFAVDEAGQVDYDACDSFLSTYETLVPA